MGILGHHTDRQLIGDAVIHSQADSAGREVVSIRVRIAVDTDKVSKSSRPDTPTIFRSGLEDRFHHRFGRLPVGVGSGPPDSR